MRINEGKVHRITSVKSAGDRAVRLRFDNGKTTRRSTRARAPLKGLKALRGASLLRASPLAKVATVSPGPRSRSRCGYALGNWP